MFLKIINIYAVESVGVALKNYKFFLMLGVIIISFPYLRMKENDCSKPCD